MGLPDTFKVQYYRPEREDLHEWVETPISSPNWIQAAKDFELTNMIRVELGGDYFYWKIHPDTELPRYMYARYTGDDEVAIWNDEWYIYFASINPGTEEDDRRVVLESWSVREDHSDLGKPTRVYMTRSLMDTIVPTTALRFVGVQVPDDHARRLGLI